MEVLPEEGERTVEVVRRALMVPGGTEALSLSESDDAVVEAESAFTPEKVEGIPYAEAFKGEMIQKEKHAPGKGRLGPSTHRATQKTGSWWS